jgi:hypothetical protein
MQSRVRAEVSKGICFLSGDMPSSALICLRNKPFEDTFITKDELTQILYHAGPLGSEVLNCFRDKVQIGVISPSGGLVSNGVLRPLPFQHVQHTVNRAECTSATTARTAMDEDRPLATWLCILASKALSACRANDFIALLDQVEQVGRL